MSDADIPRVATGSERLQQEMTQRADDSSSGVADSAAEKGPTFVWSQRDRGWSPFRYYSPRQPNRNRGASLRDYENAWNQAMNVYSDVPDWARN